MIWGSQYLKKSCMPCYISLSLKTSISIESTVTTLGPFHHIDINVRYILKKIMVKNVVRCRYIIVYIKPSLTIYYFSFWSQFSRNFIKLYDIFNTICQDLRLVYVILYNVYHVCICARTKCQAFWNVNFYPTAYSVRVSHF